MNKIKFNVTEENRDIYREAKQLVKECVAQKVMPQEADGCHVLLGKKDSYAIGYYLKADTEEPESSVVQFFKEKLNDFGEITIDGADFMCDGITIDGVYHDSDFRMILNPGNYRAFHFMSFRAQ